MINGCNQKTFYDNQMMDGLEKMDGLETFFFLLRLKGASLSLRPLADPRA